jgi:hypothetical protein
MKKTYENVLFSITEQAKSRVSFEGCHKHRMLPGYLGGEYTTGNVLFLSQREHSIVHFLRWKLYGDSRDKRAYKMIGKGTSGLSHQDRVDHGTMCFDFGIGIHGVDKQTRMEWGERGRSTQQAAIALGDKNWVYWSTPEGRKERARLGGLASYGKNQAFINQQCSFKDRDKASAAAKKSAKKPVTDGCGIMRKFHTNEQVIEFLMENPTWRRGCPTKTEKLALAK